MFLEWIDDYKNPYSDETDDIMVFNDWLESDFDYGANTIGTFISKQQMTNTDFEAWYFGHFHEDTEVEDLFYCLYDDVILV